MLKWDERPQLYQSLCQYSRETSISASSWSSLYLIEIDYRFPELILQFVEVPHSYFAKITWVVFIHVGSVMVLATSETATTRMFSVLADTTMAGRDVTATMIDKLVP